MYARVALYPFAENEGVYFNRQVNNKTHVVPSFSELLLSILLLFDFGIYARSVSVSMLTSPDQHDTEITFRLLTFGRRIHPFQFETKSSPFIDQGIFKYHSCSWTFQHNVEWIPFSVFILSSRNDHNSIKTIIQRQNYYRQVELKGRSEAAGVFLLSTDRR